MLGLKVVSQEMSNDCLVARQHLEDLTTKSQLIVYESQEAVFFKNGRALDVFGAGKHSLNTANLPLIKKFFSGLYGGNTPFPCDVFFVNKVTVLDFVWGTDSPIDLADPKYSMLVGVRANGQLGFRISDSESFILKVSGMLNEYTTDTLKKTVKGLIMSSIKECIAQTIIENKVSILEITPKLTEIANAIQFKLNKRIGDLGISIDYFSVNSITARDGDLDALKKAKEDMLSGMNVADIEAYKMQVLSEARAKARQVEGYTYAEERRFDVLENAAKNDGAAGGLINMGLGLGVGANVGRAVGKIAGDMSSPDAPAVAASTAKEGVLCSNCGEVVPDGAKFCMNCGTKLG